MAESQNRKALPEWLSNWPGAQDCLATLEKSGKDRHRILALLELIRLEHQGQLPTKEIDRTIRALHTAKESVLGVAERLNNAAENYLKSSGIYVPRLAEEIRQMLGGGPSLKELQASLEVAEQFLDHLKPFTRYNNLRDGLKALLVASTSNVGRRPRYYDREVWTLIYSATADLDPGVSVNSHKDWRGRHSKLIEEARQAQVDPVLRVPLGAGVYVTYESGTDWE